MYVLQLFLLELFHVTQTWSKNILSLEMSQQYIGYCSLAKEIVSIIQNVCMIIVLTCLFNIFRKVSLLALIANGD